jgi:hypothetical protein
VNHLDDINTWIEALRSGNYKQTTDLLTRSYQSFCCLGVLCDVTNAPKGTSPTGLEGYVLEYANGQTEFSSSTLPNNMATYYGLEDGAGFLTLAHLTDNLGREWNFQVELADLNDQGFTFDQIADVIEYYYFGNINA